MEPPDVVHLNIGGTPFMTLRDTLASSNSFFSGLLQQARPQRTVGDARVEYFIDRDPTYFRVVLNWLRGVRSIPSTDSSVLREIRWEAEYYAMTDLVSEIDNRLKVAVPPVGNILSSIGLRIGHT